jgi:hypothetical protein
MFPWWICLVLSACLLANISSAGRTTTLLPLALPRPVPVLAALSADSGWPGSADPEGFHWTPWVNNLEALVLDPITHRDALRASEFVLTVPDDHFEIAPNPSVARGHWWARLERWLAGHPDRTCTLVMGSSAALRHARTHVVDPVGRRIPVQHTPARALARLKAVLLMHWAPFLALPALRHGVTALVVPQSEWPHDGPRWVAALERGWRGGVTQACGRPPLVWWFDTLADRLGAHVHPFAPLVVGVDRVEVAGTADWWNRGLQGRLDIHTSATEDAQNAWQHAWAMDPSAAPPSGGVAVDWVPALEARTDQARARARNMAWACRAARASGIAVRGLATEAQAMRTAQNVGAGDPYWRPVVGSPCAWTHLGVQVPPRVATHHRKRWWGFGVDAWLREAHAFPDPRRMHVCTSTQSPPGHAWRWGSLALAATSPATRVSALAAVAAQHRALALDAALPGDTPTALTKAAAERCAGTQAWVRLDPRWAVDRGERTRNTRLYPPHCGACQHAQYIGERSPWQGHVPRVLGGPRIALGITTHALPDNVGADFMHRNTTTPTWAAVAEEPWGDTTPTWPGGVSWFEWVQWPTAVVDDGTSAGRCATLHKPGTISMVRANEMGNGKFLAWGDTQRRWPTSTVELHTAPEPLDDHTHMGPLTHAVQVMWFRPHDAAWSVGTGLVSEYVFDDVMN